MPKSLYVDHDIAAALSDRLIEMAANSDIDVLNTFAAFQLATMSVATMVLSLSTDPEHLEHNRQSLVSLAQSLIDHVKNLTPEELAEMRTHFEAAGVTATGQVH